jgi:hypothetical protein
MMAHLDDISFNENRFVELLHPFRSLLLTQQLHEEQELMFFVSQSVTPFASWQSLWPYTHISNNYILDDRREEIINKLWGKQGEG